MRGKKYVLMLTLTFLLVAIIASVPPVKSETYETRISIRESPPGSWIPGVAPSPPPAYVWAIVDIESPLSWDDTIDGIVGWVFSVHVDPNVLTVSGAYAATFGYFLFDFIDWNGYTGHAPNALVKEINATTGDMIEIGEWIFGYETLGKGAGGNSEPGWYGGTYGLCRMRFRSKSLTAHTLIDIYDAYYAIINASSPTGFTKIPFDVVDDGHYNDPELMYLHSQSSLIDLSSPVTSSWHELYPGYSNISSLNQWVDNDASGLSPSDYIQLNDTWYHVEAVTVTIETKTDYGEEGNSTNSPSSTSGGWATGDGAYADGGGSAYIRSAKPSASQYYGGYEFNIPTDATITQVMVRLDAWGGEDIFLKVSEDGGSNWLASQWFFEDTAGSETTYWANVTDWTSWTPAKINTDQIHTQVWTYTSGGAGDMYLDWIPIEITYIAPLPLYIDYIAGFDYMDEAIENPNNTMWHELYPVFSNIYNLTGWVDDDVTYNLTIGDYIKLNGTTYNVEDLDTDIVISGPIAEPPEFPLGLAVEIGLIVAIAYVWLRSRRKTKTTKVTKHTKLAY